MSVIPSERKEVQQSDLDAVDRFFGELQDELDNMPEKGDFFYRVFAPTEMIAKAIGNVRQRWIDSVNRNSTTHA